ncbi:hypothetical protein [Roseobacter sp. HKCCA0434]|uniref:hypothetical protein n=1 Tax=Roseobacter sp. HKCCA0434 TaxID=3079297 RepID=UPI0029059598|nr:hypothetical protein [Roseobacter sp. HKCCA0434]
MTRCRRLAIQVALPILILVFFTAWPWGDRFGLLFAAFMAGGFAPGIVDLLATRSPRSRAIRPLTLIEAIRCAAPGLAILHLAALCIALTSGASTSTIAILPLVFLLTLVASMLGLRLGERPAIFPRHLPQKDDA